MDDKQIFQIAGVIVSDKSMANGARRFTVETQENIPTEHLHRLIELENKIGNFLFAVRKIEAEDLVNLPEIDKTKYHQSKTASKRLRSVIYILFKQKGGDDKNFSAYYDQVMEGFINQTKNKLD